MAHRGGFARGGARQRKHWHQLLNTSIIELTANSTAIIDSFADSDRDPFTVLRMIGEVSVSPDEAGVVAGDSCVVTWGIGVVSTDSVAAGAASMPDPGGEADFPWLWWHGVICQYPSIGESLQDSVRVVTVDSKGMRKVGPGQSLALIAEYADVSGNPPVDVIGQVRFLVGTS